jgi:hypothetical protein
MQTAGLLLYSSTSKKHGLYNPLIQSPYNEFKACRADARVIW